MERKQELSILNDLKKKMVFLVGPRQAGKTWLAKHIAKHYKHPQYLNYDNIQDRVIIKKAAWLPHVDLLILDELHKMHKWKNYLKGIYDIKDPEMHILVTGSARLDVFRKVGDSLAGRFYAHHLMPFSPAELSGTKYDHDIDRFITRGGFPEPFLADDPVEADRWRMQYIDSLIYTDVFDFDKVDKINNMRLVLELLRTKVGSPISYQSIAEDVGIAPNTVKKYIRIFEALYIVFRLTPFANNIARSLVKEPKLYFYDAGMVKGDARAKLENLVALCLLKHVYAKIDYEGKDTQLYYLRTKDGLEVDFAIVEDGKVIKSVEVKQSDDSLSRALLSFKQKYNFPSVQLVKDLRLERLQNTLEIRRLVDFLLELKL